MLGMERGVLGVNQDYYMRQQQIQPTAGMQYNYTRTQLDASARHSVSNQYAHQHPQAITTRNLEAVDRATTLTNHHILNTRASNYIGMLLAVKTTIDNIGHKLIKIGTAEHMVFRTDIRPPTSNVRGYNTFLKHMTAYAHIHGLDVRQLINECYIGKNRVINKEAYDNMQYVFRMAILILKRVFRNASKRPASTRAKPAMVCQVLPEFARFLVNVAEDNGVALSDIASQGFIERTTIKKIFSAHSRVRPKRAGVPVARRLTSPELQSVLNQVSPVYLDVGRITITDGAKIKLVNTRLENPQGWTVAQVIDHNLRTKDAIMYAIARSYWGDQRLPVQDRIHLDQEFENYREPIVVALGELERVYNSLIDRREFISDKDGNTSTYYLLLPAFKKKGVVYKDDSMDEPGYRRQLPSILTSYSNTDEATIMSVLTMVQSIDVRKYNEYKDTIEGPALDDTLLVSDTIKPPKKQSIRI